LNEVIGSVEFFLDVIDDADAAREKHHAEDHQSRALGSLHVFGEQRA
jgi:hypothetical protein